MCNRWVELIWYELVIINVIKRLAYDEQIFGYLYIRNLVPQFIEDLLKYSDAIFGFEYFNVESNYFLITSLVILFPLLWFFTHVFKLQTFYRLYIFQKYKVNSINDRISKIEKILEPNLFTTVISRSDFIEETENEIVATVSDHKEQQI